MLFLVDSPSSPPRLPPRIYLKLLGGLFGLAAVVALALVALGLQDLSSSRWLAAAAVPIAAGSLCWELVERRVRRDRHAPGLVVWLAFPVAVLLGFVALPFLVLSVYPPFEDFLTRPGRITARLVDEPAAGATLVVRFPCPVEPEGFNLRFDGRALPVSLRDDAGVVAWTSARTLRLRLPPILTRLGVPPPRRVGVNLLPEAPKFVRANAREHGRETVPPQQVRVERR